LDKAGVDCMLIHILQYARCLITVFLWFQSSSTTRGGSSQ